MFNKLQTPSSKTLLFINQKAHNWDPFKILIPTCRIICFLLIFALTRGMVEQPTGSQRVGNGIRWDSVSLKLLHQMIH